MSVSTFGVTAEMVRASFFPHLDAFGTATSPTATTVAREINWCAAELNGRLKTKDITPSAIADTASAAYYWCQQTVALMVAVALLRVMSGADPDVAKAWMALRDDRLTKLEQQGVAALGDGASTTGSSEALGPTDHISELGLDVGDADDASDVIPALRRGDML